MYYSFEPRVVRLNPRRKKKKNNASSVHKEKNIKHLYAIIFPAFSANKHRLNHWRETAEFKILKSKKTNLESILGVSRLVPVSLDNRLNISNKNQKFNPQSKHANNRKKK